MELGRMVELEGYVRQRLRCCEYFQIAIPITIYMFTIYITIYIMHPACTIIILKVLVKPCGNGHFFPFLTD